MEYKVIHSFSLFDPSECICSWELEQEVIILPEELVQSFSQNDTIDDYFMSESIINQLLLWHYIEPIETKPTPPIIKGVIK